MSDEWYYVDLGSAQVGPVPLSSFSAAFAAGQLGPDSLCWHADLPDWKPCKEVPQLKAIFAAKPAVAAAPAMPARNSLAAGVASMSLASKPAVQAAPAPAHHWRELKTPEGQSYYHNSQTNVTTWEKPEELKTDADRERAGEWYWMPHPVEGFVPAKKVGDSPTKWELEEENGSRHSLSKKEHPTMERLYWTQLRHLQKDLVMLDVMNHPLIIYNLRERFKQNQIYTAVGSILISLNPYKSLPLYTPQVLSDYINRGSRKLDPHVFEIADAAYAQLREKLQGQSIVISGESGAGKTECTKQCLQYIAEIAGSTSQVGPEERILHSNPLLEAFGNAKTLRNNNSSRFGKYVEIFFDNRSNICGASNTNYLLEKSRVVFQTPNERNYHIFYQLCEGADSTQRSKYRLRSPNEFSYLNQSGCTTIEGVDDAEEFGEVRRAMELLSFTKQEMEDIFCICAGILHLGNISFTATGDRASKVQNGAALDDAAHLLQVQKERLEQVTCTRKMQVAGQAPITIGLGAEEAKAARDALAKFIYEKLFDWLVERINRSIGRGAAAKGRSIGILDIFGFEIFAKNSFEQLCINYTNEKLQQFFNAHTFKLEEKCYQDERIQFQHIEFIDNQGVIDLIDQRPQGILPSIDEELRMPKGSDKTWVDKLINTHRSTPRFSPDRASAACFVVIHYAGNVTYDSAGFLEKNKDQLNEDAYALLQTSSFKFLASLFPQDTTPSTGGSGLAKKVSLGTKFTRQLGELMATLNATEPHYIRCVKPNPNKAQLAFEGTMVLEQLQYAGVFEAITIRKQGFPFRLTHRDFWQRYKCIFPNTHPWSGDMIANCRTLIAEMKQDPSAVQIGTTKVLYRAEQHRTMELRRNLAVESVTCAIQKFMRMKAAKLLVERCQKAKPVYAAAIASRNIEQVEAALAAGANVGFKTKEYHQCERMKHVFYEEKRLDGVLSVLITQNPHEVYDELNKAVLSANDIEMKTPAADRARALLAEAQAYRRQIDTEAEEQLKRLEENEMKAVLDKADAVHYSSDSLDRIRTLLYDTSKDQFTKLQLKAAVQLKDRARITKTTIKLKDLFFETSGDMFKFPKFGKLFPASAWAALKFLSMDREQLAAGYLRHTKNPIHHSITQMQEEDKQAQKLAQQCFKNILGYMGDRKYDNPALLASELLRHCLEHPSLRTEIFCQLIKQLTGNPSQESVSRGWELMVLCLATFPPASDFENYLEMYLRTCAVPSDKYVQAMHESLYGGAKARAPADSEIAAILHNFHAGTGRGSFAGGDSMTTASMAPGAGASAPYSVGANKGRGYSAATSPVAPQRATSQFSYGAPAAAPAPPPPAARPAPPAPAARPAPTIPEDTVTEWYWIDRSGTQKGPALQSQLKADWRAGQVDGECIAWNANLADWAKIDTLAQLLAYLKA